LITPRGEKALDGKALQEPQRKKEEM
jgi:hypothetical protein